MNIPGTHYQITKSGINQTINHNFDDAVPGFQQIDPNSQVAIAAANRLLTVGLMSKAIVSEAQILAIFNEVKDVIIQNSLKTLIVNSNSTITVNGTGSVNPWIANPSNGSVDPIDFSVNTNKDSFEASTAQASYQAPKINLTKLCEKIINFFSEFNFTPNYRFVNTMYYQAQEGTVSDYIANYFKMIDSQYTNSIIEKMKSAEFSDIKGKLVQIPAPTVKINERLKLYYGPQGTGKTTTAIKEVGECMVCHSAILPQDLMEDFKFADGKPEFEPSALQRAMMDGKAIVLDEINLLPFESLRFLQSILDGKEEFEYKGKTIKIAKGFYIIGTMNLVVNGCTYALPEPLVDRAADIKEFKLDAVALQGALQ